MLGNKDWDGENHVRFTEAWTESTVSQWNSSGIFSQDSIRCSSGEEVKSLLLRLGDQRISQEELYSCRCSTTSPVDQKTMKKNACQMPISFLYLQKDFGKGQWSFIGLGSEKKWYSISEDTRRMGQYGGKVDVGIRRKRTSNFPCYKSIVQRSTQEQRPWKMVRYTIVPIWKRLRLFFAQLFL